MRDRHERLGRLLGVEHDHRGARVLRQRDPVAGDKAGHAGDLRDEPVKFGPYGPIGRRS